VGLGLGLINGSLFESRSREHSLMIRSLLPRCCHTAAGGSRALGVLIVCSSVCLFAGVLKAGKRLQLSTPKPVKI